ncbi:MAG: NTP transferase domain-containing protein [Hungatella sp.]|nr:NTP transferase domain-containing protein [Hungatella sp.]
MNIVLIMSGGIGNRFGAVIPKQYSLIVGRPVIDYVIDAIEDSRYTDKVVVAIDRQWIDYSDKLKSSGYDIVPNGESRLQSMKNGLSHIRKNYDCSKVVIVDSVAPFLTADIIDDYFEKLDQYDAVITAQKITGGLTDIYNTSLDREMFIVTQSPEGFRFPLLYNYFDVDFPFQETACMLPKECTRYYNYGFKNNLKLTYDFELKYAEYMMREFGRDKVNKSLAFFDKNLLYTSGIKENLLRNDTKRTNNWIDMIYASLPELIQRWEVTSFLPFQSSRFGLALSADSQKYGNVVLKFIPDFVERYERELECFKRLSTGYMVKLIDYVDEQNVLLLQRVSKAKYASYENNLRLMDFYKKVIDEAVVYDGSKPVKYIMDYYKELKDRLDSADTMPYMKEEITPELRNACRIYQDIFGESQKVIAHMDLHSQNLLDDGECMYGIDPYGVIAPIEFEFVRFIRNDMKEHIAFGYENRFDILLHSFSKLGDIRRIVYAFYIDMAFCTYNSTFEHEEEEDARIDLELIEIAKKWLKEKG